jgi:plastocyanin
MSSWEPPVKMPSVGIDEEEEVLDRRALKIAAASIVARSSIQLVAGNEGQWTMQRYGSQKANTSPRAHSWRSPHMPRCAPPTLASPRTLSCPAAQTPSTGPPFVVGDNTTAITVRISDFKFHPQNISIRLGTVVKWEVDTSEPGMIEYSISSTASSSNARVFSSPILSRGQSFQVTHDAVKTYTLQTMLIPGPLRV